MRRASHLFSIHDPYLRGHSMGYVDFRDSASTLQSFFRISLFHTLLISLALFINDPEMFEDPFFILEVPSDGRRTRSPFLTPNLAQLLPLRAKYSTNLKFLLYCLNIFFIFIFIWMLTRPLDLLLVELAFFRGSGARIIFLVIRVPKKTGRLISIFTVTARTLHFFVTRGRSRVDGLGIFWGTCTEANTSLRNVR